MSAPTEQRPRDASMSLINELLHRPIDPGYAAVAARRRREGTESNRVAGGTLALVTMLVIGVIFGISATSLGDRSTERTTARADLVAQIELRQDRVEANAARAGELQAEVATRQEQVLRDDARAAEAGVSSQLLATIGAVGVQGPGIVITLDDAPAELNPDAATEGKVLSRDVQIIVNALWAAGAEAIDVGGQRLTSRSAIRFAGEAILVNYRPLPRPYVVRAVGDPDALASAFAAGDGGAYVTGLTENFGIRTSITKEQEITMSSASALRIENAAVPGGEGAP
ncbi:MAG: DUF881 domain-containing protein [Actinomycetia bacterium]|nr:DUF881 domain-containing protein [Actinomycetes bacterium]